VQGFDEWMKSNGRIGLSGVDTRALTRRIREGGAPNGVIAHRPTGVRHRRAARPGAGMAGAGGHGPRREVTCRQMFRWDGGRLEAWGRASACASRARPHVVAIDYGSKRNIFRNLADAGADVTVLPATATASTR
jgi:carbamoyl-phosphate synthase small subunit